MTIQLRKNVSPTYRSQEGTGDPYLDVFAAVMRQAIKDMQEGNGHAEEAAMFLRENDLARRVMQLARRTEILSSCQVDNENVNVGESQS
jgi:hypothetical protein